MPSIHKLQAYEVSLEAFTAVNEALDAVPGRSGHGHLITQCRRSTGSVASNIAEGGMGPAARCSHHDGAGRRRRQRGRPEPLPENRLPLGPGREVPRPQRGLKGGHRSSQLTQVRLLRLVPADRIAPAEQLLDRVRAMLWRLARSSGPARGPGAAAVAAAEE